MKFVNYANHCHLDCGLNVSINKCNIFLLFTWVSGTYCVRDKACGLFN